MNRPLKFRVWDVTNKKWLPQSHFAVLGNGKLIVSNSGYYTDFTNTNKDDYVVQEFTGLKDKNGNDIYEGDIVNFPHHTYRTNGKIIWENLSWIIHEPGYVHKPLADFFESDIEIIGNIFELPCKIDHNAECLVCDCWPSDCPFAKFKN